jgi:hypothetical protein
VKNSAHHVSRKGKVKERGPIHSVFTLRYFSDLPDLFDISVHC